MSSTTTSTKKAYFKSEYLQPVLSTPFDSNQSPLALLAQTCSNIGRDSPSLPLPVNSPAAPTITSRSSLKHCSSPSDSDKSCLSVRRPSSSQSNDKSPHKKSVPPFRTNMLSQTPSSPSASLFKPSLLSNHLSPLFEPIESMSELLLRSSAAYLASQQNSYSSTCTIPGCLQCEAVRCIVSRSINTLPYACNWATCNAKFCSNDELNAHIRNNHRSSKYSHRHPHHHRFHPYSGTPRMIDNSDQLPYFYPHLSLSPTTETKRRMNDTANNNN